MTDPNPSPPGRWWLEAANWLDKNGFELAASCLTRTARLARVQPPSPDATTEGEIALNTAIARLQDFADSYPAHEQVDGDQKLTVDDLRLVIEAAKRGAGVVEVKGIT